MFAILNLPLESCNVFSGWFCSLVKYYNFFIQILYLFFSWYFLVFIAIMNRIHLSIIFHIEFCHSNVCLFLTTYQSLIVCQLISYFPASKKSRNLQTEEKESYNFPVLPLFSLYFCQVSLFTFHIPGFNGNAVSALKLSAAFQLSYTVFIMCYH